MSHNSMKPATLGTLARRLHQRRDKKPPVVLVGSGISIESGGPSGLGLMGAILKENPPSDPEWDEAWASLYKTFQRKYDRKISRKVYDRKIFRTALDENKAPNRENLKYFFPGERSRPPLNELQYVNEQLLQFLYSRTIGPLSPNEIYNAFHKHLQYHRPSTGYENFTHLAKRKYFEWIISTNFDPLIEEAFTRGQIPSYGYLLLTRTMADPNELANYILGRFDDPRIKLLKIHGDLRFRKVDAIGETIREFDTDKEIRLRDALVTLIRERDLIVIGHGLEDNNIQEVIRHAYKVNMDSGSGLNSLWLLSMSKEEVQNHQFLGELNDMHENKKSGAIKYLEPLTKLGRRRRASERVPFDDCMEGLLRELMHLENEDEYLSSKPFAEFRDIYHILGMTVNKRQLMHLVVAPRHHEDSFLENARTGDYFDKTTLKDKKNEKFFGGLSPIFFSSLSDSKTADLVSAGLSQQRSDARNHLVVSDFPYLSVPFVNKVFLSTGGNATNSMKDVLADLRNDTGSEKGVRALSRVLHKFAVTSGDRPLIVYCNRKHKRLRRQVRSFYENQGYKESGEEIEDSHFTRLLTTLVVLAGDPEHIRFLRNRNSADVVLSLRKTSGAVPVLIRRFIPVVTEGSGLFDLLRWDAGKRDTKAGRLDGATDTVADNWNNLVLCVGGAEHNKTLELLIALQRWNRGETLFNNSNEFDKKFVPKPPLSVLLHTESYVGGIVKPMISDGESKEGEGRPTSLTKKRGDHSFFILSFSVPTGAPPWVPRFNEMAKGRLNVVAVVGMTAIGSILGVAYLALDPNFSVERRRSRNIIINVPGKTGGYSIDRGTSDEKKFMRSYLSYLIETEPPPKVARPSRDLSKTLTTVIDQPFKAWMERMGMAHLIDPSGAEVHANLWAKLVNEYLLP